MDLAKDKPEFTVSIRGYDRLQVDAYIRRLHDLLDEAEERTRVAESELEFSRHTTVGSRVSQIFDLAVAEAKEMRARVEEEGRTRLAAAQRQGDELIASARSDADELAANSRREYDELVAKMDAERDRVTAEVNRLQEQKAQMLGELRRLHEALGSVANLTGDAAAGVPDAGDETTEEPATRTPPEDNEETAAA